LSEDGDTFVIQAGSEFKVLGVNPSMRCRWPHRPWPEEADHSTQSKLYRIAKGRA
jgi:hypothetical protein